MNKRQVRLLKELIKEQDYLSINYFSKEIGVSEKTLSKDLDEIQIFLDHIDITIERKRGQGIKLIYTDSQLDSLNTKLNNMKMSVGDDSLIHRRIQILLNLLINTGKYTTIQKLSQKYMVSRTSINNDLNENEEKLEKYNLKLSRTGKGTKVIGSEINIRKALVFTIQEYAKINPDYITTFQDIRHEELNIEKIDNLLSSGNTIFFESLLNDIENKLNLVIYEPYYTNLLTHLLIMTNRIINGNYISKKADLDDVVIVMNRHLYDVAAHMIKNIEDEFNININNQEAGYIYKYLISIRLSYEDTDIKEPKEEDLLNVEFTNNLIDIASKISNRNYNLSSNLYKRLNLHIKPMLNRIKYNIQIKNPLLKDFLNEFKEDFLIIKVASFLVCNKFSLNMISDDEVSYILSYFISEKEKLYEDIKIRAVVVCHSGYGTSQLLATRLEKTFDNIIVEDIVSSNSIKDLEVKNIDLIVSTVDLDINIPYLISSVFLNEIDKKNISNYIEKLLQDKKENLEYIDIEKVELKDYSEEKFKEDNNIYEKDLLSIDKNTYISIVKSTINSAIEFVFKEDDKHKRIFDIKYSNYKYLSKTLNLINKRLIEEEA